ncbi:unnamed protein product [Oppiella nova]|uniref:Uncharacterized protein n=1 Tax=Oppiella nova TaxID=334625 RepID=A0A7R9QBG7_9ACAR|nr:unnamed protein product [Oppiella nova]CAG2162482.1 unnamed protein product [Oppiella nova]
MGTKFAVNWHLNAGIQSQYVATGLSVDNMMGNDSVTECILNRDNGAPVERQGLTFGGEEFGVNTVQMDGISEVKTSYSDDMLSCEWTRAIQTHVNDLEFDLTKNRDLLHHKKDWVSTEAYNLSSSKSVAVGTTSGTQTSVTNGATGRTHNSIIIALSAMTDLLSHGFSNGFINIFQTKLNVQFCSEGCRCSHVIPKNKLQFRHMTDTFNTAPTTRRLFKVHTLIRPFIQIDTIPIIGTDTSIIMIAIKGLACIKG